MPTTTTSRVNSRWQRSTQLLMSEPAPLSPAIAAANLPDQMLHDDEVVLILTKPSLWFILITSFRFLLGTTLLGILAARITELNTSPQTVATITALLCITRLVWAMLVWSSNTYMLTNQRIVTIKGVLNTTVVQAHLKKIQRTVLYRPLLLKLFRIGTIGIATAANTDYDATWLMIPRPLQTQEAIIAAINKLQ